MAIAILHSQQGVAAGPKINLASTATAGNLLACFVATATTTEPKGKDNISTAWTTQATKSLYNGSTFSLWFMTKVAAGGETGIEVTNATANGFSIWELTGASEIVETMSHKDNVVSTKSSTTVAITTADAGDIALACIGLTLVSGTISAWTGTGPMTNIETTNAKAIGGSLIPAATLTAATFTANWETARTCGSLVAALKPAGAGTPLDMNV